jgi:hypothetical protein
MKQVFFVFTMLLYCFFAVGQPLGNPDFEAYDTSNQIGLTVWKANPKFDVKRDSLVRFSGQSSARIKAGAEGNFGAFSQISPISKVATLRKFRVSGYLKRDSVQQFAGIWVNVFAGEQSLFFDNMYQRGLNGTADWLEVSTDFYADETATEIQVGGLLVGKGTAWFDQFSLVEIPLSVKNLPDSLQAYLAEAIDTIQKYALLRDSVNWPKTREQMFLMTAEANVYADCYPAIRYALGKLGDHHSFLMDAAASQEWSAPADPEAHKKMPLTTGELLEGGIAYLKMPSVSSGNDIGNTYFADQLQDLLEKLGRSKPKGWILDLRANGGGNCWPMLAGIGPLLGEGGCGYFVEPGNPTSHRWFYKAGRSGIDKETIVKTSRKPYKVSPKLPLLAVLTGPKTGSSGEVVTIAFRKRPNARSFGAATAGLSTGNQNFRLRDGAQIFLTTTVYADREGEQYGSKIIPDEPITDLPSVDVTDPTLEAAKKWLLGAAKK